MQTSAPELSIVIVSFNTRDVLRTCLQLLYKDLEGIAAEVLIVDNASKDASAEMVLAEFPSATLLRSSSNLGFGNANNVALKVARGRYVVLLNSDAFLEPGTLRTAIAHMDANPKAGLGSGRLIGRDGAPQPSARAFHSVLADFFVYTGLTGRFPKSRFFARLEQSWKDPMQPRRTDWVPGAFSIIRSEALNKTGFFDPDFFLYYEEVDLCKRISQAGYEVWYWPDLVIVHLGGESSKTLSHLDFSSRASQVTLWRMRSTLLYYRKHHGTGALFTKWMEQSLYAATELRNGLSNTPERKQRATHFKVMRKLMQQAWHETNGGRVSPPQPW